MSKMTTYLEDKLAAHVLKATAYTVPATIYVALATAVSNGEAGTFTEVTGGAYTRKAIAFGAVSNGTCANSADIDFPQATANWGTVTHVVLMDAATGGNALFYQNLTTARLIEIDDILRIPAGSLSVAFD